MVQQWYGPLFMRVLTDAAQDDGLRILDVDGQHIFCHLHLSDLGEAVRCESSLTAAGA